MTAQFCEFIREEIRRATADLTPERSGQLAAFTENAQVNTLRFKRKRRYAVDGNGKRVVIPSDPVPGTETRAKPKPTPLIVPVLFTTASWRRALATMEPPAGPWLRWVYGGEIDSDGQAIIAKWLWAEFEEWLGGRKLQKKIHQRFRSMVLLAMQDVRNHVNGLPVYGPVEMARLVEANPKGWHATYESGWQALRDALIVMDRGALYHIAKQRSHQKRGNAFSNFDKLDDSALNTH